MVREFIPKKESMAGKIYVEKDEISSQELLNLLQLIDDYSAS